MIEITNELLVKSLLFIVSFSVIYQAILKSFKDRALSLIISLAVSILALFYLSKPQELFLNLTYGTLGILLLISIPLVIIFFFSYSTNIPGFIRKAIWIFYGAITIPILYSNVPLSPEATNMAIILIILSLLMVLFFDTTIKEQFNIRKNLKKHS